METKSGEGFRLEDCRADRDALLVVDLLDRAVDHQCDEVGFVRFCDGARADQRAVAQDGDPVAKFKHFLETMAYVDDRHAVGLEPPDQLEEGRGFLPGEIGRRLVEDQELGAPPFGARGRHKLLLADGQARQLRASRQSEAELIEKFLGVANHALVG